MSFNNHNTLISFVVKQTLSPPGFLLAVLGLLSGCCWAVVWLLSGCCRAVSLSAVLLLPPLCLGRSLAAVKTLLPSVQGLEEAAGLPSHDSSSGLFSSTQRKKKQSKEKKRCTQTTAESTYVSSTSDQRLGSHRPQPFYFCQLINARPLPPSLLSLSHTLYLCPSLSLSHKFSCFSHEIHIHDKKSARLCRDGFFGLLMC